MNLSSLLTIACYLIATISDANSKPNYSFGPNLPSLPNPSFETDVSFFGSGTTFGEYYELELGGFQQLYKQFNIDVIPFFSGAVSDIQSKINDFKKMIGIQEFLSLGSLYSQFIPLNLFVNNHLLEQSKQLAKTKTSSFKEQEASYHNPVLKFTVPDYNLLQNEYVSSANGNMGIVKSVIRTINAIQAATNSSTFNVTGNTLAMSRKLAQDIYDGLHEFANSAQDIYDGSKSFANNFNVTKVQKYQNSPDCSDFINDLYVLLSTASHIYDGYAEAARQQANVFYMAKNNNGTTFTTNITNMNNVINEETLKIVSVLSQTNSINNNDDNEINKLSK